MPGRSHHIQPTGDRGTRYTGGAFGITGADHRRRAAPSSMPPVLNLNMDAAKMTSSIDKAYVNIALRWPQAIIMSASDGDYKGAVTAAAVSAGPAYLAYSMLPQYGMLARVGGGYAAGAAGMLAYMYMTAKK